MLRKMAIKSSAKLKTDRILYGMAEMSKSIPEVPLKEIFVEHMRHFCRLESLSAPAKPVYGPLYKFDAFLEAVNPDNKEEWHVLLFAWVMDTVFDELSYNDNMGTEKDIVLVQKVVYNLINKRGFPLGPKL